MRWALRWTLSCAVCCPKACAAATPATRMKWTATRSTDEAGNAQPIWKAALRHTLEIFVFIFAFSLVFGLIVEGVGEDVFASVLGSMGFFQPVVAALVGLIPNCAASVLLTQLYVEGALRFSSLVAGLCTGAGVGLAVLWRTNPSRKQNLFISGLTWGAGAFLGVAMQVVVAVFA